MLNSKVTRREAKFSNLSQRQIWPVAISGEKEDRRIYMSFAED
nr:rubrerythrin [Afipia sp.]